MKVSKVHHQLKFLKVYWQLIYVYICSTRPYLLHRYGKYEPHHDKMLDQYHQRYCDLLDCDTLASINSSLYLTSKQLTNLNYSKLSRFSAANLYKEFSISSGVQQQLAIASQTVLRHYHSGRYTASHHIIIL